MSLALQGYSLLKLTGHVEGLATLRQEIGERFAKTSRRAAQPVSAPEVLAKVA